MKKLIIGVLLVLGGMVGIWLSPIGLLDIACGAAAAVGGGMIGKATAMVGWKLNF